MSNLLPKAGQMGIKLGLEKLNVRDVFWDRRQELVARLLRGRFVQ